MSPSEIVAALLITVGMAFFAVGTVGLLRFPDTLARLHALTKADNLGLGFVVLGLMVLDGSLRTILALLLIWLLVQAASTTACHLIARRATEPRGRRREERQ